MTRVGVIGGSGFTELGRFEGLETCELETPYGAPSAPLERGLFADVEIVFLPRHGQEHQIAPHLINYRANLWALHATGVEVVVAFAAVGGIDQACKPGALVLPDQILDYTHDRATSFIDESSIGVRHIDFTYPYCSELRTRLRAAATAQDIAVVDHGTYAATQGPRFETAAEIRRLERDGATIVGMTGMPEASLARELGLCYATLAIVVNAAAGKTGSLITAAEIDAAMAVGSDNASRLLAAALPDLAEMEFAVPSVIHP